jgi:hypothetical protein
MKASLRYFRRPDEHATHPASRRRRSSVAGDTPAPGEVLLEIGLMLAIHLAIALAIILTLQAFGLVSFE